ncbi:MAG: hypothetical protein M1272_00180 [Firmicutes bacterium]|nr:hypothetical protein [Bacillota bacterium]
MRTRLQGRSYVVYYGQGPLNGLESYDIVILEPQGWTTPLHRQLQGAQVSTVAYLSVLEVPEWRVPQTGLTDDDFVRVDGERWVKQPFGNWLARPDSPRWRQYLRHQADRLYRRGWDGLFLDTLGDVEDAQLADQAGWLVPATAELVQSVRLAFPERPLIVNNGLWSVVPLVAPYIDGVCWEGDLSPDVLKQPWAQAMIDFLGRAAQERGWVNFMLTHVSGTSLTAAQRLLRFYEDADRYGFLAYAAPANYADAIRLRDGRVVGPLP